MPCSNDLGQVITSPQRKYIVHSWRGNCGATTPFVTDIKIMKFQEKKPTHYDGTWIFSYHGIPEDIAFSWVNDTTLSITFKECLEVYGKDTKWKDVIIEYHNVCTKE